MFRKHFSVYPNFSDLQQYNQLLETYILPAQELHSLPTISVHRSPNSSLIIIFLTQSHDARTQISTMRAGVTHIKL